MSSPHPAAALSFLLLLSLSLALHRPPPLNGTLPLLARQRGDKCRTACRFLICRGRQTTLLGAPNKPTGPTICRRGQDIENILDTGEALILEKGRRTPISKWKPDGLEAGFNKAAIYTRPVPGRGGLSAVVRMSAKRNQNQFLDGQCVVIPILRYEKNVRGKISAVKTKSVKDCLSVQLVAPTIVIEAFWFSGDDLDLAVVEPDGTRIDNRERFSDCGMLIRDNNVDACGIFDSGGERIIYRLPCEGFQNGQYKAVLTHGSNCQLGPTTYEIRVVVNGRLKKIVTGVSNKDGGERIATVRFKLP